MVIVVEVYKTKQEMVFDYYVTVFDYDDVNYLY